MEVNSNSNSNAFVYGDGDEHGGVEEG